MTYFRFLLTAQDFRGSVARRLLVTRSLLSQPQLDWHLSITWFHLILYKF